MSFTQQLLADIDNDNQAIVQIIHPTHIFRSDLYGECLDCWGCSCHFPDILALPCMHTVNSTLYLSRTTAVVHQAVRYGEQIRYLEIEGLDEDRERVLRSWSEFCRQLDGTYLGLLATNACHEVYDQ